MSFLDAWYFLMEHRIFNVTQSTILKQDSDIGLKMGFDWKVGTRLESRNSQFEGALSIVILESDDGKPIVCLESGEILLDENSQLAHSHDYDLDVSASTFEEAIIMLAEKVRSKFGEDTKGSILSLDR
ncbi:hypothetical protein [Vibrio owensii]|uniref:hypothetical protein n=1 Tax=Vibrio owensii TaxID=696485 RepID=UPI003CC513BB